MLVLTRKVDQSITLGSNIKITVFGIKGNQVRIGIDAPRETQVYRTEIYESIVEENFRAADIPQGHVYLPEGFGQKGVSI